MYDKTADSMVMQGYTSRDVEVPRSAFGDASSALDEARDLARRVSDVVDRLCGGQPMAVPTNTKLSGGGGSVLHNLRDESERTVDLVRQAMSQLNRLDRELP